MQNTISREQFTEKIVEIMEKERINQGWTQEQMAQKMEMSTSGYKKIVSGETKKIDLFMAHRLSSITGKYLFELFEIQTPVTQVAKKLALLSPSQLRMIDGFVEFERQFAPGRFPQSEEYVTVMEPTGEVYDGMVWDSIILSKVDASAYIQRLGKTIQCGLKINSNHLTPTYIKGDILLISKEPLRDGDIGVFINLENGRGYIRRYRQTSPVCLESLNGLGESFYVDDENGEEVRKWIKFGKIITKMRD